MDMELEERTNWGLQIRIASTIFSKLPISNLPACRLVCKSWNRLILEYATTSSRKAIIYAANDHNPSNFDPHFCNPTIHCFDVDTLSFVRSCTLVGPFTEFISLFCSCNGGVDIGRQSPCIFNPMTHEFFPITAHADIYLGFFHGFGFNPKTKQYKLFLAPGPYHEPGSEYYMKILRFGSNHNQWIDVPLPFLLNITSHGVCMDGVIYWLGREKENEYVITIYALDVETESFEVVAVLEIGAYPTQAFLQSFNGTIYAKVVIQEPSHTQMWRMQVKDSWIRDFIIHEDLTGKVFELIRASDDGKIVVRIMKDLFWLNKSARTIRLETENKIKTLSIPSNGRRLYNVCPCPIETLHFGSLSSILAGNDRVMNRLVINS